MHIVKKIGSTELDDVMRIRTTVFVEEQGVPSDMEYDYYDEKDDTIHYLGVLNGENIAAARLSKTSEGYKLQRIAILKQYRRRGYASMLIKEMLNDVPNEGRVYLHAQESAIDLYTKLGFKKVGQRFEEAGIGHYLMEL